MEIETDWCTAVADGISQAISEIESSFECEWADAVHDSFQNYISDIKTAQSTMASEMEAIENMASELSSIDIDGLIMQSSNLAAEIEEV